MNTCQLALRCTTGGGNKIYCLNYYTNTLHWSEGASLIEKVTTSYGPANQGPIHHGIIIEPYTRKKVETIIKQKLHKGYQIDALIINGKNKKIDYLTK